MRVPTPMLANKPRKTPNKIKSPSSKPLQLWPSWCKRSALQAMLRLSWRRLLECPKPIRLSLQQSRLRPPRLCRPRLRLKLLRPRLGEPPPKLRKSPLQWHRVPRPDKRRKSLPPWQPWFRSRQLKSPRASPQLFPSRRRKSVPPWSRPFHPLTQMPFRLPSAPRAINR